MPFANTMTHTPDLIEAFLAKPEDGPVCMVNLLKFREKAVYEDGSETDISGFEAYQLYGGPMGELINSSGGKVIFTSMVDSMIVGDVDDPWDVVVIVEYPTRKGFVDLITSPGAKALHHHRRAGLEGQLNIATKQI